MDGVAEKLIKSIDTIESKLNELGSKAEEQYKANKMVSEDTKNEIKAYGEKQHELATRMLALEQQGARGGKSDAAAPESIGGQFVKAEGFKDFVGGRSKNVRAEVKNTILTPDAHTQAETRPGILRGAFRRLTLESMLVSLPTEAPAIRYVRENVFVNNAAEVAEGTAKPESSITFSDMTAPVETVAHWLKISEQLAADEPALVAYINLRLAYGVDLRVENQILAGNGVAPNLSGLLKAGNYTPHGYTAASLAAAGLANNLFDLIGMTIGDTEVTDWMADLVLLNPSDWWRMLLAKDASGAYIFGGPGSGGPDRNLFFRRVLSSNAVPVGNFAVLDSTQAATFYTRQDTVVEMSKHDQDNFQRNLITIRAERRCALAVERPAAIRYGALQPA